MNKRTYIIAPKVFKKEIADLRHYFLFRTIEIVPVKELSLIKKWFSSKTKKLAYFNSQFVKSENTQNTLILVGADCSRITSLDFSNIKRLILLFPDKTLDLSVIPAEMRVFVIDDDNLSAHCKNITQYNLKTDLGINTIYDCFHSDLPKFGKFVSGIV